MKKITLNSVCIIFLLLSVISGNSQKVYMKVERTKTGIIKDQNNQSKFPGRIELTGYSFETSSAGDSATGISIAGRRARTPLKVTINYGLSSILLFNCSITNEILKTVVIEVYKINNRGMEVLDQTITLTNAAVSYFKQSFDNTSGPGQTIGPKDEVMFTFQKISIIYVNGGVMAENSWNSG